MASATGAHADSWLPLAGVLLEAADADADASADALHDGPVQELVAARFAVDAAVRGGDPVAAREAVQAALVSMRRALWLLRPRGAGDGGLAEALRMLSERLTEIGQAPLALDVDPAAAARLAPLAATVCYRLVQAVSVPTGAPAVRVTLRRDGHVVVLDVQGGAALERRHHWSARAAALGADLLVPAPCGTGLALVVPHPEPAATSEQKANP